MNATIFHGTGSNHNHFWFPWLKSSLEMRGYKVWIPQLPNADSPTWTEWLTLALKEGHYNDESILIGHSSGCPLILRARNKNKNGIEGEASWHLFELHHGKILNVSQWIHFRFFPFPNHKSTISSLLS